jgi:hypothetical protein
MIKYRAILNNYEKKEIQRPTPDHVHFYSPNQPQPFCARGDSGTGVFKFDRGTCSWAVMLVGIDHPDRNANNQFGLLVSQDEVLRQIEKKTSKQWWLFQG